MTRYYNKRIDTALKFAVEAHKHQVRKTDKNTPYVYHPISVGMMLRDAGFSDDVVIAGILHDTVEDTETKIEDIGEIFGSEVQELVESVSEDKNLPHTERKEKYLERVLASGEGTKAISSADTIHNLESLLEAIKTQGDEVWKGFTKGKDITSAYYLKKTEAIFKQWPHDMAKEALTKAQELRKTVLN